MKRILLFIALGFMAVWTSCEKPEDKNPEGPIIVDAKKALTGTFIDFFGKVDWTQTQWDRHFQEMNDIGFNTVLIQFAAYGEDAWFSSSASFIKTKYPNALPRLLAAAGKKDMSVYIGLYFNDEYWDNATNIEWLQLHADRCNEVATELNTKFGSNPAFKGWYIPHEPEPYAYHSKELLTSFKDNFINRISDNLHRLGSKPVSIAAFFNSELTSPKQLKDFMAELCKSNLQIIMLQDGVGVNHVSLDAVGQYYNEADKGLYENTGYNGEFWTDLETFSFPPQGKVTIKRLKSQLLNEMATPHISKAVSFQYYADMCPDGPGGTAAASLRNDYYYFIKSLK